MPKPAAATVAEFERLLPKDPEVTRKLVFGHPAAFVRGQMFFGTFGEQLFVRLSPEDIEKALKVPGAGPFEPMAGRAMSGYVVMPAALLGVPASPKSWLRRSLEWTRALPPKKRPAARKTGPPKGR